MEESWGQFMRYSKEKVEYYESLAGKQVVCLRPIQTGLHDDCMAVFPRFAEGVIIGAHAFYGHDNKRYVMVAIKQDTFIHFVPGFDEADFQIMED